MDLIFINELGPDFRGNHIYEFIFSDAKIDLWGENWEVSPAAGRPSPPELKYVKRVGNLSKEGIELELGKNNLHVQKYRSFNIDGSDMSFNTLSIRFIKYF